MTRCTIAKKPMIQVRTCSRVCVFLLIGWHGPSGLLWNGVLLDLIGFGWVWLGLIGCDERIQTVNWSCPVSVCSNFHIRIWDPADILQRTDVSPWPCFLIQTGVHHPPGPLSEPPLDLFLYLRPTSTQCLSFLPPLEGLPLLTQSGLDSLKHRCLLPVYRLDDSEDFCCYCMKLFTSIIWKRFGVRNQDRPTFLLESISAVSSGLW